MNRPTHATEYIKHTFTDAEIAQMAREQSAAYQRQAAIEEEETVVKAQFKERKAVTEQTIGALSRQIGAGFEMRNVRCRLEYDRPNMNEVSYVREDNGEVVRSRALTADERQDELPFAEEKSDAQAEAAVESSAAAAQEFFGSDTVELPAEPAPATAIEETSITIEESGQVVDAEYVDPEVDSDRCPHGTAKGDYCEQCAADDLAKQPPAPVVAEDSFISEFSSEPVPLAPAPKPRRSSPKAG